MKKNTLSNDALLRGHPIVQGKLTPLHAEIPPELEAALAAAPPAEFLRPECCPDMKCIPGHLLQPNPTVFQPLGTVQNLLDLLDDLNDEYQAEQNFSSSHEVELTPITDTGFKAMDGSGYYAMAKKVPTKLTNFTIHIVERIMEFHPYGEPVPKIKLSIIHPDTPHLIKDELILEASDYYRLPAIIRQQCPGCWIDSKRAGEFDHIVQTELNESAAPYFEEYAHMQWSKPTPRHCRTFEEGQQTNIKRFPSIVPDRLEPQSILQMFKIAEPKVSFSLIITQASAFLAQLYEDANYPLQFAMGLVAKSGSGKTTLSTVMTQPFTNPRYKIMTIRSTTAAIRNKASDHVDDVYFIDDRAPEGSKVEQNRQLEALCQLIRAFGDYGGSAYKCQGSQVIQSYLRGMMLFTAEEEPEFITSGAARAVLVRFETKPDWAIVGYFQDHPELIAIFWYKFILFLQSHYDQIVALIKKNAEIKRTNYENFSHARQKDALIHMDISAEILGHFLCEEQILSRSEADNLVRRMSDVFYSLILEQDHAIQHADPIIHFIQAILSGLSSGELAIAPSAERYRQKDIVYLGYRDNAEQLVLLPNELYSWILKYFDRSKIPFPLQKNTLFEELRQKGLLNPDKKGFLRKMSSKADENRTRALYLLLSRCRLYLEKKENVNHE